MCLACRGIVSGYSDGDFRPADNATRGQISKIVAQAAQINGDPGAQFYEDVPPARPSTPGSTASAGPTVATATSSVATPAAAPANPAAPTASPTSDPTPTPPAPRSPRSCQMLRVTPTALAARSSPMWTPVILSTLPCSGWPLAASSVAIPAADPASLACRPMISHIRPGNNVSRGQAAKIVTNTFFPNCQTPDRK